MGTEAMATNVLHTEGKRKQKLAYKEEPSGGKNL
jgi:hypothetical protein